MPHSDNEITKETILLGSGKQQKIIGILLDEIALLKKQRNELVDSLEQSYDLINKLEDEREQANIDTE